MRKQILLLSMVIACPSFMFGQRSITDSIFTVGNVEITAKKKQATPLREQPVQLLNMDVPLKFLPITVTRLDSKTLERKHILNMEDAVRFLPGVTLSSNQLGAFQRYSIRGTSDAVFAIDGIRDERTLLNTMPFGDLSFVESIEVIKGPASILSGHSVMGGVINIITKKASADFSANASISYGSWNQKEATVGFGGKLIGPVNYRANIHYGTGDGYRDVNADRFSGLFALGAEIGKGYFEGNISFNDDHYTTEIGAAPTMPGDIFYASDDKLYLPSGALHPTADPHTVYNDFANNKMHRRNMDVRMQYTQPLTDWMKFRETLSYGHSNLDYCCVEGMSYVSSSDPIYDLYYFDRKGKKTYVNLDSLRSGDPLCFNPDNYSITNTTELTGKIETGFITNNYTLGWNYTYFDYTNYTGYNSDDVWGPGKNQILPVDNPHIVRDWWDSKVSKASIAKYITNGIYLHDVFEINDHWKGMLGGRLDIYKYKSASALIDDGRQHYEKENRTDWNKVSTAAFTYRGGIVYLPIPAVSIYASAASYFKPNKTFYDKNILYMGADGKLFNPDETGGEVFKPERGNQYEVGARYELNQLLEVNASIYYIRKHNVVKTIGKMSTEENGAAVDKNVQAQVGRADTKGFDIDLTLRPVSNLQIVGGCGWSDYRLMSSFLKNIDTNADWFNFSETTGQRSTGVPRVTFYTYADYTIPKGALKDLSFHLSGTFTDRIYQNIADNSYIPSCYIVDAGIYYTIKKSINLAVNVNNLFNKEYFVKSTVLGKPCNFMATISYNFR